MWKVVRVAAAIVHCLWCSGVGGSTLQGTRKGTQKEAAYKLKPEEIRERFRDFVPPAFPMLLATGGSRWDPCPHTQRENRSNSSVGSEESLGNGAAVEMRASAWLRNCWRARSRSREQTPNTSSCGEVSRGDRSTDLQVMHRAYS
jgi:hypothetical protein